MLDAVTDYLIITLDAEGTIATWSKGAETLTGFASRDVVGQPFEMIYSSGGATPLVDELTLAVRDGRTRTEGWSLRKDGSKFWAAGVINLIAGAEPGDVAGFTVVCQDASERHNAQELLEELLEESPDATVLVDSDGLIMKVNRQTEAVFGYRGEDLVGQRVEVLVPQRAHGRHVAHRTEYSADPHRRPMGTGLALLGVKADGTEFPVEVSLSPVRTERGQAIMAAVRDISERHQAMQQLRRQRDEILELSTPVIEVWESVLALPIIGTLDSGRAAQLTESLLAKIAERNAEVIILDISGVPTIDSVVAHHLLRTVQAAAMMGATSIMSGVRPETAQAMVHLGISLGALRSRSTLRDALQLALHILEDGDGPA
jgi:PAS domain S-box-containing protein